MSIGEFESLGGRKSLELYSKIFYDKVYKDPWLGAYFKHIDQALIESQQVDFLQGALGGDKIYRGRPPKSAHMHMVISEELFSLRQKYVVAALEEAKVHQKLVDQILCIDQAFKGVLIKDLANSKKRYFTDTILDFSPIEQDKKAS